MPKVQTKVGDIASDDAKKLPKRDEVPPGDYYAQIANAALGTTKNAPTRQKLTLEFQIQGRADGNDKLPECQGRRVWQDYMLEKVNDDTLDQMSRFRIRNLLDATGIAYEAVGSEEEPSFEFDSDHLIGKNVIISVTKSTKQREDGTHFTNVNRIDTAEEIADDDLV